MSHPLHFLHIFLASILKIDKKCFGAETTLGDLSHLEDCFGGEV